VREICQSISSFVHWNKLTPVEVMTL